MHSTREQFFEYYRTAMIGVLIVFSVWIFFEIGLSVYTVLGLAVLVIGAGMAQLAIRHFGHHHHHAGDSLIDALPIAVVLFANIAHPAVDGFSLVQTARIGGLFVGALYAASIILHEIIRQSALIEGLKIVRIKPRVIISTACIGVGVGIALGIFESTVLKRYELIADLVTLFSYGFVITELYLTSHALQSKKRGVAIVVGGVVALGILLLTRV
jgi:hypothetical protein